jgi:hypothetical protein
MDRMGHTLIQTTQKYLHAFPDADQHNLDAFRRVAGETTSEGPSATPDSTPRPHSPPERVSRPSGSDTAVCSCVIAH